MNKKIEDKMSKENYILWRHCKKLSKQNKKLIYESFIRCHICYFLHSGLTRGLDKNFQIPKNLIFIKFNLF